MEAKQFIGALVIYTFISETKNKKILVDAMHTISYRRWRAHPMRGSSCLRVRVFHHEEHEGA